jgi:hypothetical protein
VDEVLGLTDTIRLNSENIGKRWEIKTNCDSILMKSRVVGRFEESWFVGYKIEENGESSYLRQDIKLNHPTKTGNIKVEILQIFGFTDTDYLELRTVLFAICIKVTKTI